VNKLILVLVATLPPLLYLPLVQGTPARSRKTVLAFGLAGGVLAGLCILLFKAIFLKNTIKPPSSETLTVTLFVSFIEAGLLEEFFKTTFYLVAFYFLSKKVTFKPFDYLALGLTVGLGFGILENAYYALTPQFGKLNVLLDRTYTSVLAHMIMNGVFGFLQAKRVNLISSFLVAILIHAIYDFFALPSTLLGSILVRIVLVTGYGFCLWMGKTLWAENTKLEQITQMV
jgi:RsiW-degrading membrane proteinase PrsW (M82 family)